jgi:hypothetical protein
MKWPWRWRTSIEPKPVAVAPIEVALEPCEAPALAETKRYCEIVRVKAQGRVVEQHSLCPSERVPSRVGPGAVVTRTGHWVA